MSKDEMKNRISMALKDPILQQGFEIICKNLSELEKENARLIANEKSLLAERKIIVEENKELNDKLKNLASVAEVRLGMWQKYEKENAELKDIGKTAYIKGIRTMANALKEYDRTDGAWTDYFEHTVGETLKMLLKKGVIKENLTTVAEYETQELLDKQIEATYKVIEENNALKSVTANWQGKKQVSSDGSVKQ